MPQLSFIPSAPAIDANTNESASTIAAIIQRRKDLDERTANNQKQIALQQAALELDQQRTVVDVELKRSQIAGEIQRQALVADESPIRKSILKSEAATSANNAALSSINLADAPDRVQREKQIFEDSRLMAAVTLDNAKKSGLYTDAQLRVLKVGEDTLARRIAADTRTAEANALKTEAELGQINAVVTNFKSQQMLTEVGFLRENWNLMDAAGRARYIYDKGVNNPFIKNLDPNADLGRNIETAQGLIVDIVRNKDGKYSPEQVQAGGELFFQMFGAMAPAPMPTIQQLEKKITPGVTSSTVATALGTNRAKEAGFKNVNTDQGGSGNTILPDARDTEGDELYNPVPIAKSTTQPTTKPYDFNSKKTDTTNEDVIPQLPLGEIKNLSTARRKLAESALSGTTIDVKGNWMLLKQGTLVRQKFEKAYPFTRGSGLSDIQKIQNDISSNVIQLTKLDPAMTVGTALAYEDFVVNNIFTTPIKSQSQLEELDVKIQAYQATPAYTQLPVTVKDRFELVIEKLKSQVQNLNLEQDALNKGKRK